MIIERLRILSNDGIKTEKVTIIIYSIYIYLIIGCTKLVTLLITTMLIKPAISVKCNDQNHYSVIKIV